ncbi:ribosomal protein S18 acetylase RimI-like enzyme [Rhodovulum iodosum]|uniref:Ribosomal protein S18 acetylase RimI-like enzyme n=1 Tax=Rhodovulum iodosum TaxID=68291 RepID=A0ABV3XV57_9RHOB|nr:hypothetical protein [Rhodovulum robiginosum]RSK35016.1 hypothetical protein EJA01_06350 [Rhodovulum robiginosum]
MHDDGYVGSAAQVALQSKCVALHDEIMDTPGAVQGGRLLTSDDPACLGWDRIAAILAEDGFFGCRLVPRADLDTVRSRFAALNAAFDCWDVFAATPADIAARPVAAPPDGLRLVTGAEAGRRDRLGAVQAFMAGQGVVPLPAPFLDGMLGPCALAVLTDASGRILSTAYAHFPHNRHSPFHRWAWTGLAATAPEARGQGLAGIAYGTVLHEITGRHNAGQVYAMARAENESSVRMLQKLGLTQMPDRVSGMARTGDARLTR